MRFHTGKISSSVMRLLQDYALIDFWKFETSVYVSIPCTQFFTQMISLDADDYREIVSHRLCQRTLGTIKIKNS